MAKGTDEILRRVRADIKRAGQSVIYIGATKPGELSFAYTVGRVERGLPELVITAPLHPPVAMDLLNDLDKRMTWPAATGSTVDLGGTYPVLVIDADDPRTYEDFTCVANRIHGNRDYPVQQIVLCDKHGKFPPDCAEPYNRQPLLGTMPPVRVN